MQVGGIGISLLGTGMVLSGMMKHAERIFAWELLAVLKLCVMLFFLLLFGCIVYRNLFGKEMLTLAKDGADLSSVNGPVIQCGELVSVDFRPSAGGEAKMEWLGINDGRVLLTTRSGTVTFGTSLSDDATAAIINRIEAFRSLSLASTPRHAD